MDLVLQAIGDQSVNGIAKKIDMLMLQEQFSMQVSAQSIVDILNGLYGAGTYARSTLNGITSDPQGDGGRPGLVYNTQTVDLIEEIRFGTVNGTNQPRSTLRYRMRPVGYTASADFYLYNSHYKADDGSVDQERRNIEATNIRANSDALGEGTHAIYAGDYNIQRSTEAMFQTLIGPGAGQAHDPISQLGTWNNNAAFKQWHTQSPATATQFPLQALGGMDDRFDFQLTTGEMLDGEGLSYISGSYRSFGNNNTHSLNGAITTGTGASPTVLNALMTVSDHIPVVADYQLPAKMNVAFGGFPMMTTVGSVVPIDVLVQNVASALTATSADELDYTVSVSGDLVGGFNGVVNPLATGATHQVMFDTSTVGAKSGVITVMSSSQGAATPLFTQQVSFTVGDGSGATVIPPLPLPPPSMSPAMIARDNFDAPLNLINYSQTPSNAVFGATRGFRRYQVGMSPTIPNDLLDQTTTGSPSDSFGIVNPQTKTDGWFGAIDTVDAENPDPDGNAVATWQFDIAGTTALSASIDMGAVGDFEAGADTFDWTYAIDGGSFAPLFASSVNEAGAKTYTFANGNMATHQDPLAMTPVNGSPVELSNVLQTLTASILGTGNVLSLRLRVNTNGQDEGYVVDNIVINGQRLFLAADFNKDGFVNATDLGAWRTNFGLASSATKAHGDADNDGDVDSTDFYFWQRQLGTTPASFAAGAAVPEPATMVLALAALTMAGVKRRRAPSAPGPARRFFARG